MVRNEKGYTLLLVMVIITLTFILALSLTGMAMNSRLQVNKTDTLNKATDLAEMGITHYKTIIAKQVTAAHTTAKKHAEDYKNSTPSPLGYQIENYYDTTFCSEMKSKPELNPSYKLSTTLESQQGYEMAFNTLNGDCGSLDKLIVSFTTTGISGSTIKNLTGTITINKKTLKPRIGQPAPLKQSFPVQETNPVELEKRKKTETYNSATFFEKYVHVQGGRVLNILGEAFFYDLLSFKGSADIFIHGDAIFNKPIEFQSGKPFKFCVYGDTYLVGPDGNLVDYPILQNSCAKPSGEWNIDSANGLKVQY